MAEDLEKLASTRRGTIAAICVHVLTASGAVCALLATLATIDGRWETAFGWLAVALLIDGLDGAFARYVRVEQRLPRFSGERLDLIVDYLTYVFVPVLLLLRAGYLPNRLGTILAGIILVSSLFHFADLQNKSTEYAFVGFPAVWNVVAFYVFAFDMAAWLTAILIALGAILTFVPMPWVHPLREVMLRRTTVAVTSLWVVAAAWTLLHGFPADLLARIVLAGTAAYFIALTGLLKVRGSFHSQ